MTLQARLATIRDAFAARTDVPGDVRSALDGHIARLLSGGAAEAALRVGEVAPMTSFLGPAGDLALADELAQGPVVLTWIRGDW